jgi:histidinol phosphatase-like PHP family hydrolase
LLKVAREHWTRISLGTDAHHPWQLELIELGLAAALRAKLSAQQIVNFMPIPDLKRWIQRIPDPSSPTQ